MFNTFLVSYRLKNTYRVNGIIYGLKQIPIIKKFLPVSLYKNTVLKTFANVLSTIWEIISIFLGKIIYFAIMLVLPLMFIKNNDTNAFLQLLLFLSIAGALFNTEMFSSSKDKYYAIILMKMDARELVLSQYFYTLIKHFVGFTVCFIFFLNTYHYSMVVCYILSLAIVSLKLLVAIYYLNNFKKKRIVHNENNNTKSVIIASIIFVIIGYVAIYFNLLLSTEVLLLIYGAVAIIIVLTLVYVLKYPCYHQFAYKLLNNSNIFINLDQQELIADSYRKVINLDTNINSNKIGFEYFNELFMQRHKKILWKRAKHQALFSGVIVVLIIALIQYDSTIQRDVGEALKTMLPYMVFLLYLMNTAKNITRAMFVNCDHCMLSYSFYRIPKNVLKLFQIRLRETIKINLLPTLIIAIGYVMILLISNGSVFQAVVSFVSIISMSIFFSTHYLILYYLLQPYNAYTEVKSPIYTAITSLTYIVCYAFSQTQLPILTFGIVCILFCISYTVLSCVLVYKKAGTTFKIRN